MLEPAEAADFVDHHFGLIVRLELNASDRRSVVDDLGERRSLSFESRPGGIDLRGGIENGRRGLKHLDVGQAARILEMKV